jgi:hypothetical protein
MGAKPPLQQRFIEHPHQNDKAARDEPEGIQGTLLSFT